MVVYYLYSITIFIFSSLILLNIITNFQLYYWLKNDKKGKTLYLNTPNLYIFLPIVRQIIERKIPLLFLNNLTQNKTGKQQVIQKNYLKDLLLQRYLTRICSVRKSTLLQKQKYINFLEKSIKLQTLKNKRYIIQKIILDTVTNQFLFIQQQKYLFYNLYSNQTIIFLKMLKQFFFFALLLCVCLTIRVKDRQQHQVKFWHRDGKTYKEVCQHYNGVFCPGPVQKVTGKCCYSKGGSTDTCGSVSGCKFGVDTLSITDMKWDY